MKNKKIPRGENIQYTRYLYQMVSHNMLRTHEGNQVFSDKKYPICDCSRTNPKPYTGKITEIAPYVRTYF